MVQSRSLPPSLPPPLHSVPEINRARSSKRAGLALLFSPAAAAGHGARECCSSSSSSSSFPTLPHSLYVLQRRLPAGWCRWKEVQDAAALQCSSSGVRRVRQKERRGEGARQGEGRAWSGERERARASERERQRGRERFSPNVHTEE